VLLRSFPLSDVESGKDTDVLRGALEGTLDGLVSSERAVAATGV